MGIFDIFKSKKRSITAPPVLQVTVNGRTYTVSTTTNAGMMLAAVWRCVDIVSGTVASWVSTSSAASASTGRWMSSTPLNSFCVSNPTTG